MKFKMDSREEIFNIRCVYGLLKDISFEKYNYFIKGRKYKSIEVIQTKGRKIYIVTI